MTACPELDLCLDAGITPYCFKESQTLHFASQLPGLVQLQGAFIRIISLNMHLIHVISTSQAWLW